MKNLDVMEYAADAQRIDETLMRRVLAAREGYDYEKFDALSVKRALSEENLSVDGLKALLSPAAGAFLGEMAEAARAEGILPQLVFLTSYAEFGYAQQALRLQAADYLLKPVDEAELATLMQRLAADMGADGGAVRGEGVDWALYLGDVSLNPYVRHAMERIRADYREKLSIEVLAEEAGVSASYLSRKFKEATGQTFLELLTRERLQNAIAQLTSGKYRVYEVAEENGFGDYKNFCSVFKKYMKCSPREFLQQTK